MKFSIVSLLTITFLIAGCSDSDSDSGPVANTTLEEAATIFSPVSGMSKVLGYVDSKASEGDLSAELEAKLDNCTLSETSNSNETIISEAIEFSGADCPVSYALITEGSQSSSQLNMSVTLNYSTEDVDLIAETDIRSINCSFSGGGSGSSASQSGSVSINGQCSIVTETQGTIVVSLNMGVQISGDNISVNLNATASNNGKIATLNVQMNSTPAGEDIKVYINGQDATDSFKLDGIVTGI